MSCVYVLYQDAGVVYVGKTNDLDRRIKEHSICRDFNRVSYFTKEDERYISDLELTLISKYKPMMNTMGKLLPPDLWVEIPDMVLWKPYDISHIKTVDADMLADGVCPRLSLSHLYKCLNGVTISAEMLILWAVLYKEKVNDNLNNVTLTRICKTMNMDRYMGKRLLEKMRESGIVLAELVVKNCGVREENKSKAPKKWVFLDVQHPDDV